MLRNSCSYHTPDRALKRAALVERDIRECVALLDAFYFSEALVLINNLKTRINADYSQIRSVMRDASTGTRRELRMSDPFFFHEISNFLDSAEMYINCIGNMGGTEDDDQVAYFALQNMQLCRNVVSKFYSREPTCADSQSIDEMLAESQKIAELYICSKGTNTEFVALSGGLHSVIREEDFYRVVLNLGRLARESGTEKLHVSSLKPESEKKQYVRVRFVYSGKKLPDITYEASEGLGRGLFSSVIAICTCEGIAEKYGGKLLRYCLERERIISLELPIVLTKS